MDDCRSVVGRHLLTDDFRFLVIRVTAIIYVIETGNGGYAAIIE
jgi:hypothetical protein